MSMKMTLVALGSSVSRSLVYLVSQRSSWSSPAARSRSRPTRRTSLNELLVGMESLKASGTEHAASQHWAGSYVDVMNINLRARRLASISEVDPRRART